MAEMEKLAQRPEQVAKKTAETRKRGRNKALKEMNFEAMNNAEKDNLLKALAVKAGLIDDTDD